MKEKSIRKYFLKVYFAIFFAFLLSLGATIYFLPHYSLAEYMVAACVICGFALAVLISNYTVRQIEEYERKLAQNRKDMQEIMQNTYQLTMLLRPDGALVRANAAFYRLLGINEEDAVNKLLWEGLWCKDSKPEEQRLCEAIQKAGKGISSAYETTIIDAQGEPRTVDLSIRPMRDTGGKIYSLLAEGHDITERKVRDKEKSELLRNLGVRVKEIRCLYAVSKIVERDDVGLKEICQGVADVLADGWQYSDITCAKINIGMEEFTSYNFKQTPWKIYSDIKISKERSGAIAVYYLEERPESDEGPFLKEERHLIDSIAKQIANAVERRKTREELAQARDAAEVASRAKSEFLSNMSHELRTPLNAVIGFSEVLIDGSFGLLNDKQKEYVTDIWNGGKHLLLLINDILDLSKIEAGKMTLSLSDFDLAMVVDNSLSMIKEKAMKHDIQIVNDIRNVGIITADERKIKQILFNLLSNAAKFTPDGGKIGVEVRGEKDEEVLIRVWDTGIGIEDKDKEKVFREFEQVDSAYSRKYAGTGLGMPLTKKLVEMHGGEMWFESEGANKGTSFSVLIPKVGAKKILRREVVAKIAGAKEHDSNAALFAVKIEDYPELEQRLVPEKSDEIVLDLMRHCKKILKPADFAGRKDKDSIVIALETKKEFAPKIIMRLKQSVKRYIFELKEDVDLKFSYGVSVYPDNGTNAADLLDFLQANLISETQERLAKKIMVVDDDEQLRGSFKIVLNEFGFKNITEAGDGEEALRLLSKDIPHLIILDITMPKVNGYELIAKIKSDANIKNVPIIIISGHNVDKENLSTYFVEKDIAILTKPFEINKVEKILKYLL